MKEEKSLLIKMFGNSPEMRIIDFFLNNTPFDFSKKEIIKETGMSKATFYANWEKLEKSGIIKISRRFGKAKLYELNKDSPLVKQLFSIEKHLIKLAAEKHTIPEVTLPAETTQSELL